VHVRVPAPALFLFLFPFAALAMKRDAAPMPGAHARMMTSVVLALALVACLGAPRPDAPRMDGPRVRVLGSAQDGGLPHAGCACDRCEAAAHDGGRLVASLALLTDDGPVLVDATPDIREQLRALADVTPTERGRVDRKPVSAILLTHAHMGHYSGLLQLGFEALNAERIPVYATPKMNAFLRDNAPWDQLVDLGNIELHDLPAGGSVVLGGVTVSAFEVPHRNEYADTVGFRFTGARNSVVYIPDTAPWDRWPVAPESVLQGADVALVDGTFFSLDELPGRSIEDTGHPLMLDTVERFAPMVHADELAIVFTHLNHSNPAVDPQSDATRRLRARGFEVVREGREFPL
jgi:pyrroloquinoline quinone biosynthesis protein B